MYLAYSTEEKMQHQFNKLRARAMRHQLFSKIRGKSTHLMTFDEALADHRHVTQHDAGIQLIELEEIVGTVGRTHDFDDEFNPKHDDSELRWCSVATAIYDGKAIPVIELYRLDDGYYIIDGNHRVSVMKSLGQEFVEAHVIEVEDGISSHRCQTQEIPVPHFER